MENIDKNGRHLARIAVYAIIEKDNKILLQQRANSGYMDGYYGLPSGHVDAREGLVDALIREIKEETSVDVLKKDVVFDFVSYRLTQTYYNVFFFKILNYSGEFKIMEPKKCSDLKFFDKNNLPENLVPELKEYFDEKEKGLYFKDLIF